MFKLVDQPATVTKLFILTAIFLLPLFICGQNNTPVKFGKISADDLKIKTYRLDSSASAMIIADIGSSQIKGNMKGWFSIEFTRFKRIHILNKNGYDLADVEILLYKKDENEEELRTLKAHTYNLEDGKIVETKVDIKNSVYTMSLDKDHIVKKFTFPALKEGSVIEFEYTVKSDFIFNLQPWRFQGAYPCLRSEYEVSIPDFLYYVFLQQGNITKTQKSRQERFLVTDTRGAGSSNGDAFNATVNDYRMVMKNVPAMKEESFTSTLDNHVAKVEFQLAEIRSPLAVQDIMGDWTDVCQTLLKDEFFGEQLSKDNTWMNDELKTILQKADAEPQKAKNIYKYLQTRFTCTNYSGLYATRPFKNVFISKMGNVAEINLLLVAMLRKAGFTADPLLLSTVSHGYAYADYPVMERFNYVICRAKINNEDVYLDASRPYLGFGHLYWECYNGHARIINEEATAVNFSPDSLIETKMTTTQVTRDSKGDMKGSVHQTPGFHESYFVRSHVKEVGLKDYLNEIGKTLGPSIEVKGLVIDSLDNFNERVQVNYNFIMNPGKESRVYINPMFNEGYKENPFKAAHRNYPVEMPYPFDEVYVLQMDIPAGYEVEELPKPIRVNLDEDGKSFFEYMIATSGGNIDLRSRIKLARSYFLPAEYELLRDFFNIIVDKQTQQIVFKEKNP